ncbi:hypothetical protein E4T42_06731 [Aureobasidium subglaciale]|nr:hypothetical protein E4T42_06731 [Aureobasidium subglaciale]
MPVMSLSRLSRAINEIRTQDVSAEQRLELKTSVDTLSKELETPWDTAKRIVWQEVSETTLDQRSTILLRRLLSTAVCQSLHLYSDSAESFFEMSRSRRPCTNFKRSEHRLLRNLATNGLLVSHGAGIYAMADFARSLAQKIAAFNYSRYINLPMIEQLASYLIEQHKDSSTTASKSTAFGQALNTSDTLFDYISKHSDLEIGFTHCIRGVSESGKSWVDVYPTESLLRDDHDGSHDRVVVVDVGESTGHDINAFQRNHRPESGRLVLQDLENVSEQAEVEPNVTIMPHNFFNVQTVKARAFYLHSILHDWQDNEACDILRSIVSAMQKGKSKILLHELAMYDRNTPQEAAWMDITMLAAFNCGERNLEERQDLVTKAGLKITGHFCSGGTAHSILELELA